MPIEPQVISGFHGGVSQQSPTLRADNQCAEAINCSLTIAEGCSKRSPVEVVNLLASADLSNTFCHWITDVQGGRYLLTCQSETIEVYRLSDGQKLNVLNDTGQTYLTSTNPRKYFRALNVENRTYIVNTETTVTATGSTTAGVILKSVQSLQDSDLDGVPEGSICEVVGHSSTEFDTHYIKKSGGKWYEWVKPGISDQIDQLTMPHALELIFDEVDPNGVRFEFNPVTWEKREVGDEESNKFPSFMGDVITGLFYTNGRLGFLSTNTITLSRVDDETQLFKKTVTDLLDDDRIDVKVKGGTTSPLRWAKPMNKSIVIFTEDTQYTMSGDPVITPGTVRIDQATTYETSGDCEPTNAGANIFFAVESGNNTTVREMYVQDLVVTTDTQDVTAHCPRYVPKNVSMLEAQNNLDILVAFSEDTPNKLWVYQYYYSGDQKVQSAWSHWELNENVNIVNMKVIDNYLYLVFTFTYTIDEVTPTTTTETFLGRINLKTNDPGEYNTSFNGPICLDFIAQTTLTYEAGPNRTNVLHNFPIMCPELRDDLVIVLGEGHAGKGRLYEKDTVYTFSTGNTLYDFYVPGDWWDDGDVFVGTTYRQSLELSRQYYRGEGESRTTARMQIRTLTVSYLNTVAFDFNVKVQGRDDVGGTFITDLIESYSARTLGTEYFNLNAPQERTGSRRFPVLGNAQDTTMTLINDHWNGANWVRGEMEVVAVSRRRRR